MAGHEAFEQGTIEAMQIADRIRDIEQRLEVHMQRRVSKRCNIDQGRIAVGGLQGQAQIYRHGGGATSTFCIH